MTLRKYKKLLMSHGIDRDLAESLRRNRAYHRTLPNASEYEEGTFPCEITAARFHFCKGSKKKLIHTIAEDIKAAKKGVGYHLSTIIGYNPDTDHLFDPQQQKQSKLICGGCRRPIYFGEIFYTLIANISEMNICTDCYREIERSASMAGEEIYV